MNNPFEYIEPPKTLDIHSPTGTKAVFKFPKNGREYDREKVIACLELLEVYTVKRIRVGQSSSTVEFEELPRISFNTVHFANINMEEL